MLWFANRYNYSERLFITLLVLVVLAACVTVVCYGAYCFGTLLEGARRMAKGDLHISLVRSIAGNKEMVQFYDNSNSYVVLTAADAFRENLLHGTFRKKHHN